MKKKTRKTNLVWALRHRVSQRASAGDDDRGLVVVPSRLVGVGESGRPAGGRRGVVPVRGGGVVPPHWDGHGDDQRDEAVVPGPLAVQALCEGGAPRPVGLLMRREKGEGWEGWGGSVSITQSLVQAVCVTNMSSTWIPKIWIQHWLYGNVAVCPSGHTGYCMQVTASKSLFQQTKIQKKDKFL